MDLKREWYYNVWALSGKDANETFFDDVILPTYTDREYESITHLDFLIRKVPKLLPKEDVQTAIFSIWFHSLNIDYDDDNQNAYMAYEILCDMGVHSQTMVDVDNIIIALNNKEYIEGSDTIETQKALIDIDTSIFYSHPDVYKKNFDNMIAYYENHDFDLFKQKRKSEIKKLIKRNFSYNPIPQQKIDTALNNIKLDIKVLNIS